MWALLSPVLGLLKCSLNGRATKGAHKERNLGTQAQIQAGKAYVASFQAGEGSSQAAPRLLSPLPLSEDQVAQETEEVFRSYTFYRYQQEREEGGAEVPMDPEIMEIQQELGR